MHNAPLQADGDGSIFFEIAELSCQGEYHGHRNLHMDIEISFHLYFKSTKAHISASIQFCGLWLINLRE
jgi:hypothetical protein